MVSDAPLLTSSGFAFPPAVRQDDLWEGFFSERFGASRRARHAFSASGIEYRHAVANPLLEDLSSWSTGARMTRYAAEAMPLGKEALARAFEGSGTDATEIGLLVVASCTGYTTPGVDALLARDLGMAPELKRLFVGHVGCHAALPALDAARAYVRTEERAAAVLCLELPSLHLQDVTAAPEQAVVHALFSDAAAALVLEPARAGRRGLAVLDVVAMSDTATASYMGWEIGDQGFTMALSPQVPDVLASHIAPLVERLLARNALALGDVSGWAIHPGGPRIVDIAGERLGLGREALAPSRTVLREHGNCSSPTVLVVLDELVRSTAPAAGSNLVLLAFGPGLTLYGALLQVH